jgi:hypothetical protein
VIVFRKRGAAVVACLLLVAGSGCTLQRTVTNWRVRDLDPSFIEVGRTTFLEVLRELGPPTSRPSRRHLKYAAIDERTCRFRLRALFLMLPFRVSDKQRVEELQVEFSPDGVVTGVYKSWMDVVRPPLQGEEIRPPYIISALEEPAR